MIREEVVIELKLLRNSWKVDRGAKAQDIHWRNQRGRREHLALIQGKTFWVNNAT